MAENTQAFNFESKKQLTVDQFENAVRVEAATEKPVKKVHFVTATPKILSSEKVGETLNYTGKTAYNIVYETEEGKLASCIAESDWTNKTSLKEDVYFLKPVAVETNITGVSATEILLSTLLNVEVSAMVSEQVTSVEGLDETYVASARVHEYQKMVNQVSDNITEVAEEEVKDKLDDILYYNGDVRLLSATAGIDTITLEGEILVNAYGMVEGKIASYSKTIEFKQEVAALSSLPAHKVEASVYLSQLKVTASVGEEKTNLVYSAEVHADAVIYATESATVVEDAFCLNKNLNVARSCVACQNFVEAGNETANVTGTFQSDYPLNELYFAYGTNVVSCEVESGENGLVASGFVSLNSLAQAESGEMVSVNGNVPYAVALEKASGDNLVVTARAVNVRLRSATEIEASIEINVCYKTTTTDYISSVCEIEEGEDKPQKSSAIRVYVVKENEDLFAVAKSLNMRPDSILSQNPGLDEGVEAGTRVVVYSQLETNFN